MKKFCIEHTDLYNGSKSIIASKFESKSDALKALAHRFGCVKRAAYKITEIAFSENDDENSSLYFCYRSRSGREEMLSIVQK